MVAVPQSDVALEGRPRRPCIAILLGASLSDQNLERIGIPYLSPHADIVVFDCMPWLGRSDAGLHHEPADWHAIEVVVSEEGLKQALHRHQPDYALDFIGLVPLIPAIQRIMAAMGICFVVQKTGSLPQPSWWASRAWHLGMRREKPTLANTVSVENLGRPSSNFLHRVRRKAIREWEFYHSLLAPDLALLAGRASLNRFTRRARRILWVGSQDYHLYQRTQEQRPDGLPNGPYAVFVDDNLPYASDWALSGRRPPVSPEQYYPSMRRFLSQLELQWGMPVVVAAHPSARHDERVRCGFEKQQELAFGRTADLVRHAQGVLIHGSTAVSFAVLGNRPLLFLSSEELQRSSYGLHVQTMAKELGHEPLNIDGVAAIPSLASLSPRNALYTRYIDRYLCRNGCTEAGPWQAFIDYINAAYSNDGVNKKR